MRKIIALMLVLAAFRVELVEYGKPLIEKVVQVKSVIELVEPNEDMLKIVNDTQLDNYDYTTDDAMKIAIFHDQLAKDIDKLEVPVDKQKLLDHHYETLNSFVAAEGLDKKYDGFSDSIRTVTLSLVGTKEGSANEKIVRDYADLCETIAWVVIN